MALQSSGPISFADINNEFARGTTTQLSMSQLYRGGAIVPNATVNQNIPTSGTISLNQFYGATRRVAINITISSNQTNYVLNTAKAAGYVAGVSDVVLTINTGVYVSSNSTGTFALDVDTSWAAGDTVRINNNGFIIGMGGGGGSGGYISGSSVVAAAGGGGGGPALRAQRAATVQNNGTIAGGGGGGGGGGGRAAYFNNGYYWDGSIVGGPGGGGGRSSAAANSPGGARGPSSNAYGTLPTDGGPGTVSAPGNGGTRGWVEHYNRFSGYAGNGGGWGATGGSGTAATSSGGSGGGGGTAVSGNGNITWTNTGTRLGAIT